MLLLSVEFHVKLADVKTLCSKVSVALCASVVLGLSKYNRNSGILKA